MNNFKIKGFKSYEEFLINQFKKFENEVLPVNIGDEEVGLLKKDDKKSIKLIKKITKEYPGIDEIRDFLKNEINVPKEDYIEHIINLLKDGDWEKTYNYLKNRDLDIDYFLKDTYNPLDINKEKLGLGGKSSMDLIEYNWDTKPSVGKGELWLALILKNGNLPLKGDVGIGDEKTLEVKGHQGRLYGQSGFGDAELMRDALKKTINNIANHFKINNYKIIDDLNDKSWNINKTPNNTKLEDNLKEIAKKKEGGKFSKEDIKYISEMLIKTYKIIYKEFNPRKYKDIFIDCIDLDGSLDYKKYNKNMFILTFEYYYQLENFDYFTVFNKHKNKILTINPKDFSKYVNNNILDYFPPSWSKLAGAQGGVYGITLK